MKEALEMHEDWLASAPKRKMKHLKSLMRDNPRLCMIRLDAEEGLKELFYNSNEDGTLKKSRGKK